MPRSLGCWCCAVSVRRVCTVTTLALLVSAAAEISSAAARGDDDKYLCSATDPLCGLNGEILQEQEEGGITHPDWVVLDESADGDATIPQPQSRVIERVVLEDLFRSTGGTTWYNNDGWLSDAPFHEWRGIRTDEDGHVVDIRLVKMQLDGTIPSSLVGLSHLQYINLSRNKRLGGTIPKELGRLTKLTDLHVYMAALSGTIPQALGRLTGLTALNLQRNKITGDRPMDALTKLTELTYIDLRGNNLNNVSAVGE